MVIFLRHQLINQAPLTSSNNYILHALNCYGLMLLLIGPMALLQTVLQHHRSPNLLNPFMAIRPQGPQPSVSYFVRVELT